MHYLQIYSPSIQCRECHHCTSISASGIVIWKIYKSNISMRECSHCYSLSNHDNMHNYTSTHWAFQDRMQIFDSTQDPLSHLNFALTSIKNGTSLVTCLFITSVRAIRCEITHKDRVYAFSWITSELILAAVLLNVWQLNARKKNTS